MTSGDLRRGHLRGVELRPGVRESTVGVTGTGNRVRAGKTAVARLSPGHVFRPRLTTALARAGTDQVVLVSAPAGYGKTRLLAEWAAVAPGVVAWVNLDGNDNEDRRFWTAVVAALESCLTAPVPPPALPDAPSRDPAFLAAVVAGFESIPGPVRLIIDDLQALTALEPLHGLAGLIRSRGPGLQLILAARSDPVLPVGRMRLTEELCELRAGDLAFSVDEAQALLVAAGVRTSSGQVRLLVEQTDGWAAGLRLAAPALRESADPDVLVADLVANDRAIAEYLIQEIFAHLSPEVMEVLSAVSVCEQVTAQLAAALTGRAETGDVLLDLERTTSLVSTCGDGRRWFRVHPLLRAHLNADLRRGRPDLSAMLNKRAARWYETAQEPVAALRHARAAGDRTLLIELLRRNGAEMATQGHHVEVNAAVGLLEEQRALDDPHAMLVGALAQLEVGNVDAVGRLLDRVAELGDLDGTLDELIELIEVRRDWLGRPASGRHLTSVTRPVSGATGEDATHGIVRASAAMSLGRYAEALRGAKAAVDTARSGNNPYLVARATTTLSVAQGIAGDLRGMTESAALVARTAPTAQWAGTEGEALNAVALSYGLLMEGRPDQCLARLATAAAFVDRSHASGTSEPSVLQTLSGTFRTAASLDLAGGEAALAELRGIRVTAPVGFASRRPEALLALFEHDAAVRLGCLAQTRAVLTWAAERLGETGDVLYLRAWAPASISRFEAARGHLRPLLETSVDPITPWVLVDAWLLECHIALRLDCRSRARESLHCALEHADRLRALRPLIGAPAQVAALLLQQIHGLGRLAGIAEEALELRRVRSAGPLQVALTERERAVLVFLPSLMTLGEIAEELSVSVNTVKTHVRAIYRKLGVDTRRSAVAAALRLGLLTTRSDRLTG